MDIHNYKKRFERTLERIREADISNKDKALIYKFKDYNMAQGISYGKLDAYLFHLMKFITFLKKPIEEATKDDMIRVIGELNQTKFTEQTKVSFKIAVRKLYKIVRGVGQDEDYPPEVSWIKTGIGKNHLKLPEELLTQDEIKELIRGVSNFRDKAFLSVLAESGARCSEIGLMQIKHVSFEQYGARITISGKTGCRKILVISSTPYLQEWLNLHPLNKDSDAFLWYNSQKNHCLSYARISAILKNAANKAGIKKRVYPHLLRHSQATHMAPIMTESAMKQYFGWAQGSKMAGIYVHMSGKDTDASILRANGIEVENKKIEQKLSPIKCERCKTINESTNRFCKICGLTLSVEEAQEILVRDLERKEADKKMDILFKDPEILAVIKKKAKLIL